MKIDTKTFKIFKDNQECIKLAKFPENNKRVKHNNLKYNFIHENLNNMTRVFEYLISDSRCFNKRC